MKQIYFAFLLLAVVALSACRKDGNDIDIKTYDQQQIDAYIKANSLTGMKRDTEGGDTTGMYYQILAQGKGETLDYPTRVAYVFTIKSLDGSYVLSDTISNHNYGYVGSLPTKGLQLAMLHVIKNKGTSARVIIPSRLAYGKSGISSGTLRLKGNSSLDIYINVMDDRKDPSTQKLTYQDAYDDISIRKYAVANGIDISTYTHEPSGLYWKKTQPDTGKVAITDASTIYTQYTGSIFNGSQFDISSNATEGGVALDIESVNLGAKGFAEGVKKVKAGAFLSLIMPSSLGYGYQGSSTNNVYTIPPFSCLRFEIKVISVTNN